MVSFVIYFKNYNLRVAWNKHVPCAHASAYQLVHCAGGRAHGLLHTSITSIEATLIMNKLLDQRDSYMILASTMRYTMCVCIDICVFQKHYAYNLNI